MKNIVYGLGLCMIVVLSLLSILTIDARRTRKENLEDNLSTVMKSTAETYYIDRSYSINNEEEFVADFLEVFLSQIDSDCTIDVDIYELDFTNGVFTVEVTEHFKQPLGIDGAITCRNTVFLNRPAGSWL